MGQSTVSQDVCVVERTFDAPAALVWEMWTQPEHFKKWYGPKGFSIPVAEIDVQVGGKHLICMEMPRPDGTMKMWFTGEFTEIIPNKRLVFTDSMADENGNVVAPSAYGMSGDHPHETVVTVEFEDLGDRTKLTLTHTGVPASAKSGWEQAFEKMADYMTAINAS